MENIYYCIAMNSGKNNFTWCYYDYDCFLIKQLYYKYITWCEFESRSGDAF